MRRVAIISGGAFRRLDAQTAWERLVAGKSDVGLVQVFAGSDFPVRMAAEVKDDEPTGAS